MDHPITYSLLVCQYVVTLNGTINDQNQNNLKKNQLLCFRVPQHT